MRSYYYSILLCAGLSLTGCMQNCYSPPPFVVEEKFVHRYGVTCEPNDWERRGADGQVVSTLKNGVVVTKCYAGGELDGETQYTFPHSDRIHVTENYGKGELLTQKMHYNSGSPEQEIVYLSPNEIKLTTWYETGTPKSIERIENDFLMEGKYFTPAYEEESVIVAGEGTRVNRDGFGQLISRDTISQGNKSNTTIYYPDGAIKEVFSYSGGEIDGERRTYTPLGEPISIETWKNGLQDGITYYYENGDKVSECPFVRGAKTGIERRYKLDGNTLVEEITWKHGKRHGPSFTYIGNTKNTLWFFQDRQVSQIEFERLKKFQ